MLIVQLRFVLCVYVFVLVRLTRCCFVLGDIILKLALLRRGLGELLVAVGLLRGLLLCLRLELGDHVRDEALDLAEDVLLYDMI